jgi:hypothetical protein
VAKKAAGPVRKAAKSIGTGLTIRGSAAWREWLESGAQHCRTDVSKLIDAAVVAYLRAQGFTEDPPKR